MSDNSDTITITPEILTQIRSADINSVMVFNFLIGVYTLVYGSTVYLYMSKKPAGKNKFLVIPLISILYLLTLYTFCSQWTVVRGVALIPVLTNDIMPVVSDVITFTRILIADILLIWRCYHVWGGSIRSIAIPLVLFTIECGLYLTHSFFLIKFGKFSLTHSEVVAGNVTTGALLFISVATTASTSFLIGHRIHIVSREHNLASPSRKKFNHIVLIVIESAAIYSIILLIEAIQSVLPSSGDLVNVMNRVNDYLQELMYFATGIAPTIVVARVAIAQMKTEETGGVSYIGTHGVSSNIPANSLLNGAGIQAEEKPKSTNLHSE